MRKYCIVAILLFSCSFANGDRPGVASLGEVIAGERALVLAAPEGSVVGRLFVKRGDHVEAGTELARLRDYETYEAAVQRAEKDIALAEATLALVAAGERDELIEAQRALLMAREASSILHERRKERYGGLHTNQFVSSDQFEEVDHDHSLAQANLRRERSILDSLGSGRKEEIREAEARLAVARAELELELARLETQRIRAPITGVILAVYAYQGEAVRDDGILKIADTGNMMVLAEVYETDVARISMGQRAVIRSPVFDGEMNGEVVEIYQEVETGRIFPLDPLVRADRRVVTVRVKPDQPERLASFNNVQVTVIFLAP